MLLVEFVDELAAQHLAGRGGGQFFTEYHPVGCSGSAQALADVLAQLVGIGRGALAGHHDRDDDLAPLGVLGSDDHTGVHVGMLDEDVFDLGRRDVLAAADDRVVGSTADEQVSALVKHGNVLGREPALGVEHRADLGVSARHLVAADEQFAGLARAEDRAVVGADLHLDAGYRLTDRAEPPGDRVVRRARARRGGRPG